MHDQGARVASPSALIMHGSFSLHIIIGRSFLALLQPTTDRSLIDAEELPDLGLVQPVALHLLYLLSDVSGARQPTLAFCIFDPNAERLDRKETAMLWEIYDETGTRILLAHPDPQQDGRV
jgi:hypothetical protein